MHIIDLAIKDLMQIVRDWKVFMFMLAMPIVFTLFFGVLFNSGGTPDPRLPVGVLDQDNGELSPYLLEMLEDSEVIRPEYFSDQDHLQRQIADGDLAAGILIPPDYSSSFINGEEPAMTLWVDPATNSTAAIQGDLQVFVNRLLSVVHTAEVSAQTYETLQGFGSAVDRQVYFMDAMALTTQAWKSPPISLELTQTGESAANEQAASDGYAHTSPGMMAQFAIAGLISAAEIIVRERKTRSLQRLLTTAVSRLEILIGHFLAMFAIILAQFVILIAFGQLCLGLRYDVSWAATVLMTLSMAAACASLGLLIGSMARSEEQVIVLTLVPMFVFSGLGGAWVPMEYTAPAVQAVGHVSPVAWMMDGFKNILVRGQGLQQALLPAGVLLAFGAFFFILAVWRFRRSSS